MKLSSSVTPALPDRKPPFLSTRIPMAVLAIFLSISFSFGLGLASRSYALDQDHIDNLQTLPCHLYEETINPISYKLQTGHPKLRTATSDAVTAWNRAPVPGYFAPTTSNPDVIIQSFAVPVTLYVANMFYGGCWLDYFGNSVFSQTLRINYNLSLVDSFTTAEWAYAAAHELGHTYGLDHIPDNWEVCALMKASLTFFGCSGQLISQYEIQGVRRIYPNSG